LWIGDAIALFRQLAIDDVVLFRDREPLRIANFMPYDYEYQRPAATLLLMNLLDRRNSSNLVAYAHCMMKLKASSSPHASR